jgi:hypothetical protein
MTDPLDGFVVNLVETTMHQGVNAWPLVRRRIRTCSAYDEFAVDSKPSNGRSRMKLAAEMCYS